MGAPLPLWVALQKVKSVSSCIVDLVALLSLFLRSDCEQTLQTIVHDRTTDADTETGGDILQAFVRLLDSDLLLCTMRRSSRLGGGRALSRSVDKSL
jgi:hypothetical protein